MKSAREPVRVPPHLAAMALVGLLCPGVLPGQQTPPVQPTTAPLTPLAQDTVSEPTSFEVSVAGELISLNAVDASVNDILDAIGRQMRFPVVSRLEGNETVTLAFEGLTLDEALERLDVSFLGFRDQRGDKPTITRLFVFPKDESPVGSVEKSTSESSSQQSKRRPEPFKFEFDPLKATEVE